jgi:hypothetical protein
MKAYNIPEEFRDLANKASGKPFLSFRIRKAQSSTVATAKGSENVRNSGQASPAIEPEVAKAILKRHSLNREGCFYHGSMDEFLAAWKKA